MTDECRWRVAIVDGHRLDIVDAKPKQRGICPLCGACLLAKKGTVRAHHWCHYGVKQCDDWYQPKGPWHIAWQNQFPIEWQEYPFLSDADQKHIADIFTASSWTIECQMAKMSDVEKFSRENFYGEKMIWIAAAPKEGRLGFNSSTISYWAKGMKSRFGEYWLVDRDCRIFGRTWMERQRFVFIDTKPDEVDNIPEKMLLCFPPGNPFDNYDVCCIVKACDLIEALKGSEVRAYLEGLLSVRYEHSRYCDMLHRKEKFEEEQRWTPTKPVVYMEKFPRFDPGGTNFPVPIKGVVSEIVLREWHKAARTARSPQII